MSLPRSLYCSICSDVLTCPVRTPCGHVFCKECLFRWMHRNATCPIDRNPIRPETVQDDLFVASLLTEVAASPVVEKESSWKIGLSFPDRLSTRENTLNCFSGFSTISTSIPTREYSSAHSFPHSADIDIDSVASSSVSPNQFSSSMAVFAPVTSPLSIPQSDSNPSSTSSSPSNSPRSIPSLSPLQIGSPESPRSSMLPSRSSYIEREINSLRSYIQSQSILVRRLMQNLSQNQSRDSAKSTEVAQKMFAQLDRKKNGYVEEQSVNRLLAHFSITPAQTRKIMSLANPNKNGKLVLFEFVVAIELVKKVLRGETLPDSLSEPFLTYVSYRLTKDVVTQSESDDSNEDDDDDSDSDDDDDFDEDYEEDDSDGDAVCDEQPWWGPPEDLAPGSNEII